jgi:hypothetical protein
MRCFGLIACVASHILHRINAEISGYFKNTSLGYCCRWPCYGLKGLLQFQFLGNQGSVQHHIRLLDQSSVRAKSENNADSESDEGENTSEDEQEHGADRMLLERSWQHDRDRDSGIRPLPPGQDFDQQTSGLDALMEEEDRPVTGLSKAKTKGKSSHGSAGSILSTASALWKSLSRKDVSQKPLRNIDGDLELHTVHLTTGELTEDDDIAASFVSLVPIECPCFFLSRIWPPRLIRLLVYPLCFISELYRPAKRSACGLV